MKRSLILVLLSLIICTNTYTPVYAAAKTPDLSAKGAVLMELDTGRVLYEKNADIHLPNASTTKIMTAILALEKCGLNDVVTASKKAAATPPVKMNLQAGEKQTMEDLLYALMLESANDAAVAIAEHIGGSVENFALMMNDKARQLGAYNTEFVTPNGLDSGNHHSTARDMALIARHALKNGDFLRIISTKAVSIPTRGGDFKPHSFVNKDRLLSEYAGALGIKTGYTGKAGHCFVGAANREGMTIVSVVLGSGWGNMGKEQKWIDTKRLLDFGFNNYRYTRIAEKGTLIKTYTVENSKKNTVSLRLAKDLTLPLTAEEAENIKIKYTVPETLDAPIKNGQKIGYADVLILGEPSAVIEIASDKDVPRVDFKISMGKVLKRWTDGSEWIDIKQFSF